MSEKIVPGPLQDCSASIQEAVCINTKKIFDSCRDQDCIEDLRFYPVQCGQDVINNAVSVKNADQFQPWILYCGSALFLPRSAAGLLRLRPAHGSGRTLCV